MTRWATKHRAVIISYFSLFLFLFLQLPPMSYVVAAFAIWLAFMLKAVILGDPVILPFAAPTYTYQNYYRHPICQRVDSTFLAWLLSIFYGSSSTRADYWSMATERYGIPRSRLRGVLIYTRSIPTKCSASLSPTNGWSLSGLPNTSRSCVALQRSPYPAQRPPARFALFPSSFLLLTCNRSCSKHRIPSATASIIVYTTSP